MSELRRAAKRMYDYNRLRVSDYEQKYRVRLDTSEQLNAESKRVFSELDSALSEADRDTDTLAWCDSHPITVQRAVNRWSLEHPEERAPLIAVLETAYGLWLEENQPEPEQ